MNASWLACMVVVASVNGLPPRVLPAIQAVEGGRAGTVSRNADGSEDLGVMQINTRWLPVLARHTRLSEAELRERLIHDACFNIAVAGAILRTHLDEARGDLMRAIGNYHSRTPALHAAYRQRVLASAAAIFGGGSARAGGRPHP